MLHLCSQLQVLLPFPSDLKLTQLLRLFFNDDTHTAVESSTSLAVAQGILAKAYLEEHSGLSAAAEDQVT